MAGGSGASDRNNATYFPPVRRHLVNAGIAVLSYDKRGVGSSSGDWQDSTIDDRSADALAAQERHALATALRQDSVQDVSRTLALYDQLVKAGRQARQRLRQGATAHRLRPPVPRVRMHASRVTRSLSQACRGLLTGS
jgi:hypothetical protein